MQLGVFRSGWLEGDQVGLRKGRGAQLSVMLTVFLLVNHHIPRTPFPQSPVHAHGLSKVHREPSMFPQSPVFVQRAKSDLFPVQRAPGPGEHRSRPVLVCLVCEFYVSEVSFSYAQRKAPRSIEHPDDEDKTVILRNLCFRCCCDWGAAEATRSPCRLTPWWRADGGAHGCPWRRNGSPLPPCVTSSLNCKLSMSLGPCSRHCCGSRCIRCQSTGLMKLLVVINNP